jgi:hypothetical protein
MEQKYKYAHADARPGRTRADKGVRGALKLGDDGDQAGCRKKGVAKDGGE